MPRRHEKPEIELPAEEIHRQLDQIFDDQSFQASLRRREMLKYITEETLAGRENGIKATSIAMEVFDRGPEFDQQSDPVVRLEARKLRRDLDNYYASSGRYDPIRISIPKGHYIPKFERQNFEDEHEREEVPVPRSVVHFAPKLTRFSDLSTVLLAAVLSLAGFVTIFVYQNRAKLTASYSAALSDGARIFIEPFEAHLQDELSSLVAEGLTGEIAGALVKFPDLRVHLTRKLEPSSANPSDAGPELLGSAFTLSGRVWQEGSEVLVRAELVHHPDGEVLWSERYTEVAEENSITRIQDAISANVATAVGQQYGYALSRVREDERNHRPSLSGFACVSSAQIYRRTYHKDQYQAARDCLEETVRRDPEYARAWAMLAYLRNDASRFGHDKERSRGEAIELARVAAARAIDLDPNDTDALQAMSHVEQYAGNLERSIEFAHRAVEVNPNDPSVLANYSLRLAVAGQFTEAVTVMQRAVDRSVAPPPFYFYVFAADHLIKQEWSGLLDAAEKASVDGWSLSQALLAIANNELSNEQPARRALKKMEELDPPFAENPRKWLDAHNYSAVFVNAVVEGLGRIETLRGE